MSKKKTLKEKDIKHENGPCWVADESDAYVVYQISLSGTHSIADSAYSHDADGLSIAKARCDYLAKRKTKNPKKAVSMKMRNPEGLFIVSKTYEIVTPESAEEGDVEERGFEFENTKMTLAEVLYEVKDLGSHVVQRDGSTRISLYGQGESVDYRTGDTTTYALHIRGPSRAISRLEDILVPGQPRKRASADKRERGIIKWFGKTKGFGFIASSSVDRDIFFHYADIRDWEDLLETELDGREVEFTIEDTMKGPIARDIKVLRITRKNPSSRRDSQTYTYHFHEERGEWSARVDDEDGNTVWNARSSDEEDGEFWPARDGFMRHIEDTRGLEKYLKSLEILPMSADLVMGD